jgi:uncharacterized oxidoreductase
MELKGKTILITGGTAGIGLEAAKLVNALIAGIKKDRFTIRVGNTSLVYLINRLFPKMAYGLVNPAKIARLLHNS